GRVAAPLTTFLDQEARYVGFDVSKRATDWCDRHIAPLHAGFQFHHADIYNVEYNRGGAVQGAQFCFPCDDETMDFAFATSVFTHMGTVEVKRYLAETARVLRPGGRGAATFFILNEDARANMERGLSNHPFQPAGDGGYVVDPAAPGRAVAYDEADLRDFFSDVGLTITDPIKYGGWSRGETRPALQDFVAFHKPAG
ncbi:MAG: class I SAM-dependent methyltransferase, partial [Pseudomonadota bacterium]